MVRRDVEEEVETVVELEVRETERRGEASFERNAGDSFDMISEFRSRFWCGSSFAG